MIFLRNESLKQYIRLYPVTSIILGINLLMFLLLSLTGGSTNNFNLIRFGAQTSMDNDWWRYITSMFLHAGFGHLLFNGFALYVFAPPLEQVLKRTKYTALYFVSGISGGLLSQWIHTFGNDPYVSVGASGAVYGVFGAYLYIIIYRKGLMDVQSTKTVQVLLIIGLIYSIVMPSVNLSAHLGGFIGGFLAFSVFVKLHEASYNKR